jgi:hypothetical protein
MRREQPVVEVRREPVARTPERVELAPIQSSMNVILQRDVSKIPKQPTYETDTLTINGTKITSINVQLKIPPKRKELTIEVSDGIDPKFKLEYKGESTEINIVGETEVHIKSFKVLEFKNISKDKKVQWGLQNLYTVPNKQNITIITLPA